MRRDDKPELALALDGRFFDQRLKLGEPALIVFNPLA